VSMDPDILLVDEVLSVGDERFQQKCLERVKLFQEDGRTIVVVSIALFFGAMLIFGRISGNFAEEL